MQLGEHTPLHRQDHREWAHTGSALRSTRPSAAHPPLPRSPRLYKVPTLERAPLPTPPSQYQECVDGLVAAVDAHVAALQPTAPPALSTPPWDVVEPPYRPSSRVLLEPAVRPGVGKALSRSEPPPLSQYATCVAGLVESVDAHIAALSPASNRRRAPPSLDQDTCRERALSRGRSCGGGESFYYYKPEVFYDRSIEQSAEVQRKRASIRECVDGLEQAVHLTPISFGVHVCCSTDRSSTTTSD
jgi:hypothetical protein